MIVSLRRDKKILLYRKTKTSIMEKKTSYINLWELQTYPEKFLMAKLDIESDLPEEERKTLNDFITALGMQSIYMNDGIMIPFAIKDGNISNYVFYTIMDEVGETEERKKQKTKAFDCFVEKLESIGYDFSRLTKKTNLEIFNLEDDDLDPGEFFLIGHDFYK